jgi:pilus assembly protein TadC
MTNVIYESIGRIFSRRQMRSLGALLDASGLDFVPEAFAGFAVIVCLLVALILYLLFVSVASLRSYLFRLALLISTSFTAAHPLFYTVLSIVFSIAVASVAVWLMAYIALLLMADARRRKVEDVLPEFLSLSAANVRAGMTIDQAMWYSAKPQFGTLSDEVAIVAKRTFGGMPFNVAIDHLSERFNSKAVRRSVALIKQGIASGGKVADILEKTAEDSRQMAVLRKEISTSLLMYVIFIVFAAGIGTPFLFAVSGKLVVITESVFSSLPQTDMSAMSGPAAPGVKFVPTAPQISPADFFLFTVVCTVMTAIFSSLIIGVISRGSRKDGVAYLPVLLVSAFVVFLLTSWLLSGLLPGAS